MDGGRTLTETESNTPFIGKIRYVEAVGGYVIEQYHPDGTWKKVEKFLSDIF